MHSIVISSESYVISSRGPVLPTELAPGVDDIWVLGPNGSLQASPVGDIAEETQPAWRVLTAAGDLILASEAVVMTADGPLKGEQIHRRLATGTRVRIDTISPAKLPIQNQERCRLSLAEARASLRQLGRPAVRLPHNGTSEQVYVDVENILAIAEIEWDLSDDERWLTYRFERAGLLDSEPVELAALADPLISLTAWEMYGAGVTSRIRLDETMLLATVTGALAASKVPFEVNWVPRFSPVECRVSKSVDQSWPVFLDALAAAPIDAQLSRVETEARGKVISGLSFIG